MDTPEVNLSVRDRVSAVLGEKIGTVLVTGGTGRVGTHLVRALINEGCRLRVATPDPPAEHPLIEWCKMDFRESVDFDAAVHGCRAILHLGAELWNGSSMIQVNQAATRKLVESAERHGVVFFCYTSTICVYGSPKSLRVTEESPLISTVSDRPVEYMAPPFLREYARTKLLGEVAIRELAKRVSYVILRPTAISAENDILGPSNWRTPRKIWRGSQRSHQIYVHDVVSAIIFFLQRNLSKPCSQETVEVFNLSNDDADANRYFHFWKKAYEATENRNFWCPFCAPVWLHWVKDVIKFKNYELRYPLGMVRFAPEKLLQTGYRHPVGIAGAHARTLSLISRRRENSEPVTDGQARS